MNGIVNRGGSGTFQGQPVFDSRSMSSLADDFTTAQTLTGYIGNHGWGASGTVSITAGVAGHPGIINIDTTASSGTLAVLVGNTTGIMLGDELFIAEYMVRLNTNDSNTLVRIGWADQVASDPSANGIYIEKDYADTTWQRVTRASSTETSTDTTISTSTGWVYVKIRSYLDGATPTIGFTIDSNAEQTSTTNLPTVAMAPVFQIKNNAAAAKDLDIDAYQQTITGLTRQP